jgi:hypothetical protein
MNTSKSHDTFEANEAVFGVFDDGASLSIESKILATVA